MQDQIQAQSMTNEEAEAMVRARMPEGFRQSRAMLDEFMLTVPDGTPEQVKALIRRTFIAGALSHMEEVGNAMQHPSLATGDPTVMVEVIASLGLGATVLIQEENAVIMRGASEQKQGLRLVAVGEGTLQ